jgi:hypothetical protein
LGRTGLIDLIKSRIADGRSPENVYMLVDQASAVLAGNLEQWPSAATVAHEWTEFRDSRARGSERWLRAVSETLPTAIVCWSDRHQRPPQVAAVAHLHGARIEMLDQSPGLQFKLWFSLPAS